MTEQCRMSSTYGSFKTVFCIYLNRIKAHILISHRRLKYLVFHSFYCSKLLSFLIASNCSIIQYASFSSVQSLSRVWLFVIPWTAALQASLSITNSRSSPKPMSIELEMPSSHLILCRPLFLLPSIFLSIRVFSSESALRIRWPKYWSFSFSISPSNEYSGLISYRMDWLDLSAVQGTLKSLLQHHNSKASILLRSAFFIFQLSHPYMTTGNTRDPQIISWGPNSDGICFFVNKVLLEHSYICSFTIVCGCLPLTVAELTC